jgi:hypothetical protein
MSDFKTAEDLMSFNHLWHKSQDRRFQADQPRSTQIIS